MNRKFIILFLMTLMPFSGIMAQLSPGDLTSAHSSLEGIMKCTECHSLGKKVDDKKCLACHKEIDVRVKGGEGYHASSEVAQKECAECHSEHHGRNFEMIRLDKTSFDHLKTGYELTGKHTTVDCRKCHKPDNIEDSQIRKRKDTYLGLEPTCVSCHDDYHQKTLSTDCKQCHNTDAFSPAAKFDHNKTDYPLTGKHKDLDCAACHKKEVRNGKEFQDFAGLNHANCNSCHEDAHRGNLGTDCRQCHNEQSFSSVNSIRNFNHSKTGFPLRGKHQEISCSKCHNLDAAPTSLFQDKKGFNADQCAACHDDAHDNRFGNDCRQCHNENSFRVDRIDNFNHSLTDFTLLGKHNAVDCRKCHTESLTAPLVHNQCAACHSDYHEGQFVQQGHNPDCAQCHTEEGFDLSTFSINEHDKLKFRLEGSHLATPCFACHLKEDKWQFREIGERCADCHEDIHYGRLDEKYYPEKNCVNCHSPDSWQSVAFEHASTGFTLSGKHAETTCSACHTSDAGEAIGFTGLEPVCSKCHENIHEGQFAENGITDCARCHGFTDWGMQNFDHDRTEFKLEGKHAELECSACHKTIEINGKQVTQYHFDSFRCIDCHL